MNRVEEPKLQTQIPTYLTQTRMTLTSFLSIPAKEELSEMLIRKRIEKLERASPPTITSLIDRIEGEAMKALARDQQGTGNLFIDGVEQSPGERYQKALSSALKQVSDEDLDRIILYCDSNACRVQVRQ